MVRGLRRRKWFGVLAWLGGGTLATSLLLLLATGTLLFWLAASYSRTHPLDLAPYLPKIERYLQEKGLPLKLGTLQVYYDGAPVVKASEISLLGPDGEVAVFVEEAAVRLSNRGVLLAQASPKAIEAKGVTLRLVRKDGGLSVAGLALGGEGGSTSGGLVAWLNGLTPNQVWGRLKYVRTERVNLLFRDDVQHAEWVLENGNLTFNRYVDNGERGTLIASVRRLYGNAKGGPGEGVVMPVLVTFDHPTGAEDAYLSARFDQTDVGIVADYLPDIVRDLLRAQGSVELGVNLKEGNAIGQPWVTLRLAHVEVLPPKGYSAPMVFPKLTMTASYDPSPTDTLIIKDLAVVAQRGNVWQAHGSVTSLTTDPLLNFDLMSEGGDVQGIFDFFPDQPPGLRRSLAWLRPNIMEASYRNLKGKLVAKVSAFPHCGDACGTLEIDADVAGGKVKFLPEMSPAELGQGGSFRWRGQRFTVSAPVAKVGDQTAENLRVTLTNLFDPAPTGVLVSATISGQMGGLMRELRGLDKHHELPKRVAGKHRTGLDMEVPLPRGRDPEFSEIGITADGAVSGLELEGLPELGGQVLTAPAAEIRLFPDKSLRLEANGKLGINPLSLVWQRSIDRDHPGDSYLNVNGTLDGKWLLDRAKNPKGITLTGPVGVVANMVRNVSGTWRFGVRADTTKARLALPALALDKPAGEALNLLAQGVLTDRDLLRLDNLDVSGTKTKVVGSLKYDPANMEATELALASFRVGGSDVGITMAKKQLSITGKRLDISGMDLFEADEKPSTFRNGTVLLKVDELVTKTGRLQQLVAQLTASNGRWDINQLTGVVPGGKGRVDVRQTTVGNRKRMKLDVEDLGGALSALGLYERLRGGTLRGEMVYTAPQVASGTLVIKNFELANPPVLVRLLSMLSLQQLLAGTDTTLFDRAVVPLRLNGSTVTLANVLAEGPSMSLQLNGTYTRGVGELNIDGRLAPAIPLNRLVAKIPLIGTILTGSQDGVVVADFKMKGPAADPDIHVRPLSVLTPGLLKDLWRGITGD